ncbi:MAG TPA: enoyl-CoA hydratase-related protein [Candidatus Acidoferrales bacterium]|jgi:2-(1,2-epoxy-1,2-dihydrophenyl)acetyl-CoA isomerase|nr:enoyl-CoA hydratase-related protein [Candidatus Acidoferrales bacterium]
MSTEVANPPVLEARDDSVLTLTLNRPNVLNAITDGLLDILAESLREAATDDEVRAVIVTGAGRAFCSGQDLKTAAADGDLDIGTHLREHYVPAIHAMRELEKPVVAAVNGVAAGAGFSLALAADLRIAAESASFVQAFVRIGLIPDASSTYFLPRIIGPARAAELMMLGDSVDSARALDIGLVNRVVPDAELGSAARDLALRLARGPRSIGLIKRALNRSLVNDLDAQLRVEEQLQTEAASSADFYEGVAAFLEKRQARFNGR